MGSNVLRVLVGIALIVVAIVLLVVLKGTDNGTSESDSESGEGIAGPAAKASGDGAGPASGAAGIPTIVVRDGEPVGGVRRLEYNADEQIRFKVESDVSDEVHIHGYDLIKDVKAGGPVGFDFPATIEGVFEVELEGREEQILELRVIP
jgi:hypothetical protein